MKNRIQTSGLQGDLFDGKFAFHTYILYLERPMRKKSEAED